MATLEKIRTKAGILITIVIGIALLAFVLGDFLKPGNSILSKTRLQIGKVYGQSISVTQFQQRLQEMEERYKKRNKSGSIDETTMNSIIDQTWNMMIEEILMEKEYKHLGITVSDEELKDLTIGKNKDPQIRQAFTDPKTGVFRLDYLKQYISQNEEEWIAYEEQIRTQKSLEKYFNLLMKGITSTTLEAKMDSAENSKKVNFRYIMASFNSLADSAIKVTDHDYNAYFNKHKKEYEQEASRSLEYVLFPIDPSNTDYVQTKNYIAGLKKDLEETTGEDLGRYVNLNSDTRYEGNFLKKEEIPSDSVRDIIFDAKEGTVIGPVFEKNSYRLFKLVDTKKLPDSVRVRHILISVQKQEEIESAKKLADSIKAVVEKDKGASFAEMVKKYSADQGSVEKGGEIGWVNAESQLVPTFKEFCLNANKGDVGVVPSEYGYHIIHVEEEGKLVKKVQIAILDKKVIPSNATRDSVFKKANVFAGSCNNAEQFDANVAKMGLEKKIVNNLRTNDRTIEGLNNPKKIVHWAFDAKENEISKAIDLEDQWVIAKLTKVIEEGIPSWKSVKDQLTPLVIREKKADKLTAELKEKQKNVKSLEELASVVKTNVEVANDISFSSYALPTGYEPSVIAAATVLKEQTLSPPIKGMMGIYVVAVDSITNIPSGNVEMAKANLTRMNTYPLYNYSFIETLKKVAHVKDERRKFNY